MATQEAVAVTTPEVTTRIDKEFAREGNSFKIKKIKNKRIKNQSYEMGDMEDGDSDGDIHLDSSTDGTGNGKLHEVGGLCPSEK